MRNWKPIALSLCVIDVLLLIAIVVVLGLIFEDQAHGQALVIRDCPPDTVISNQEIYGERFGIIAINCPGVIIERNQVWFHGGEGSGGGGIVLFESPGGKVRGNTVRSYGGYRSGVGIRVHRSDYATVEQNWMDLRGETNDVDGECIAVNSGYVVVQQNTVRGCPGIGILLWGGVADGTHGNTVIHNTVIDPGYGLKQGKNWAYPAVTVIGRDSVVTGAVIEQNLQVHTGDPKSRKSPVPVKVLGLGCEECTINGNGVSQ